MRVVAMTFKPFDSMNVPHVTTHSIVVILREELYRDHH